MFTTSVVVLCCRQNSGGCVRRSVPWMGAVTILDGGMGRELERIGAPFRQPEWSALAMIESPEHVRRVHESYVEAGAEVITTNAYALVPFHIGQRAVRARRHGGWQRWPGRLAREVADAAPGVRVAGCLPPVLGSYQPELFVRDEARPILDVLVLEQAPFVDLWLAETQSSIDEVGLVARRARCPSPVGSAVDLVHAARRAGRRRAAPAVGRVDRRRRAGGSAPRCRGRGIQLQPARGDGAGRSQPRRRSRISRSASTPTPSCTSPARTTPAPTTAPTSRSTTCAATSRPTPTSPGRTAGSRPAPASSEAAAASAPSTSRRCRHLSPAVSLPISTRASGGMADALASGASIRKDVGVQVPPRPPL